MLCSVPSSFFYSPGFTWFYLLVHVFIFIVAQFLSVLQLDSVPILIHFYLIVFIYHIQDVARKFNILT